MSDPLNPPARVTAAATASEKLAECRALYGQMLNRTQMNALDGLKFGKLLIEAKAEVKGRGESWLDFLKLKWPTLAPRTAQAWMRRAFHGGAALAKELIDGTFPEGGDETDEELEEFDPSDPRPDRGDASEDADAPDTPAPKKKPAAKKPAPALDLEPDLTEAKQFIAEARDAGESFKEFVSQVLASRAGNSLRRLARLSGEASPDGETFLDGKWPPVDKLRRWLDQLAKQGFDERDK